jgi:hypothetical protein
MIQGESCWWTIHPASKQRSEGEKVRFNDDVILVSVFSERYLVRQIHYETNSMSLTVSIRFSMPTCLPVNVAESMHRFVNKFGVSCLYLVELHE